MKFLSKKSVYLPIIIALIAALLLTAVKLTFFTVNTKYVNASIELKYDGAAEGLGPNGDIFNIENIKNTENLSAAIDGAGLDVSVDELKNCITIQGVYPDDLAEKIAKYDSLLDYSTSREVGITTYNPTKYSVTLFNSFEKSLSPSDLKSLFSNILSQYEQYFADHYSAKIDWDIIENTLDKDSKDFFQDIEALKYEAALIEQYSAQLAKIDPTFAFDGIGFNDVESLCRTFNKNVLSEIDAGVLSRGISLEESRLKQKYQFEVWDLMQKKAVITAQMSNVDGLIDSYNMDSSIYMSSNSGTSVVASNSKKTYEALVEERRTLTEDLAAVNAEISKAELSLDQLDNSSVLNANEEDVNKAKSSIENAKIGLSQIKKTFADVCEAYNKEHASSEILGISGMVYHGLNSLPKTIVKTLIKLCIVTECIAVMYILGQEAVKAIRKKKGSNA